MSRGLHKAVNRFITTLKTSSAIDSFADSGTFEVQDITVGGFSLPQGNVRMYATVDFAQTGKEEIFRIKNVTGSVLTFDLRISVGGYNKPTHVGGASFRINDVSELVNDMGLHIDNCGFTEKIPGTQTIVVNGGNVNYKNVPYAVPTATLAITSGQLVDNSTNYVLLNLVTQAFVVSAANTANGAIAVASVVCSGGSLGAITDLRPAFNTTYEEIGTKVDKAAGLRDSFGANKIVYVDPTTGSEVIKNTSVGTTIADTELILSRDTSGNEKRTPFSIVKNQFTNSGKFTQTVPLYEDIGAGVIALAVMSSSIGQGSVSQIPALTSNTSAPGITVSCSISPHGSSSAYLLFDGNNGTGLYSGNYYNPASVTVDFGKTVYATVFDVNFSDSDGYPMMVQGSPDNLAWTTLISPVNPGNNTNLRYRGPGYRYYRVVTPTNTGHIFQFNTFQVYYRDVYCDGVYFNNVLGSNIAENRIKAGIRFSIPYDTTLGTVRASQLSTSSSARLQLLDDTGVLITEVAVAVGSDVGVFSNTPLIGNSVYRLVINDTANFGNNSNELALASYQTGFRYAISGTLNGNNSVLPQNIIGVQIGTLCAVKATAALTTEYSAFAGCITGPKIRGDLVELNANDGVLVSGFSGLTPQTKYYLSNTDGQIASSAGTISRQVGMAMSATEVYIASPYYPGTNISRP